MDGTQLIGSRFGKLTVIGSTESRSKSRQKQVVCSCDCGTSNYLCPITYLKVGHTVSCGCHRKQELDRGRHTSTHGMSSSPEWMSWKSMKQRCGNPNARVAKYYLHRGITYCPEWEKFEVFLKDVGPRPSPHHSLERINNNGNYEPGNVKWATKVEQMNNTRRNHYLTFEGKTLTVTEWANIIGILPSTLDSRINRLKWSTEKALTTPKR